MLGVAVVVAVYGGLLAVSLQSSFGGGRQLDASGSLRTGWVRQRATARCRRMRRARPPDRCRRRRRRRAEPSPGAARWPRHRESTRRVAERTAAGASARGGQILIGAEIDHDNSAAYNAIGVKGVATGDQNGMVQAVVKWINGHGGMAGRTVVPVIHESQVETSTFAAQAQSACSDFTEDHHVFAVVGRTSDRDDLYRCLAPKGVPFVAQHRYLWDRQSLQAGQPCSTCPAAWAEAGGTRGCAPSPPPATSCRPAGTV